MNEPRPVSAFGCSLAERGDDWTECMVCGDDGRADEMLVSVLFIEAEARATVLRELREEVEGMPTIIEPMLGIDTVWVRRAAVLDAIDRRLE